MIRAQAAARTRCAFETSSGAVPSAKGHKKSVVALAHKMLRTVYAMLNSGTFYQDPGRRLRGLERGAQCPALAQDAAKARLHRRAHHRLSHPLPLCLHARASVGQALRLATGVFH